MMLSPVLRLVPLTLLMCACAYPLIVLVIARIASPDAAEGQLLADASGQLVGSRQIAQRFSAGHYLWPRPSAVDYNASGAGGSNLAVSNPDLRARAVADVARFGATDANPLPQELAAASGAGLDPHVTLEGALWQAPRISAARGISEAQVRAVILSRAEASAGGLLDVRLVNVLETNLALDAEFPLGT